MQLRAFSLWAAMWRTTTIMFVVFAFYFSDVAIQLPPTAAATTFSFIFLGFVVPLDRVGDLIGEWAIFLWIMSAHSSPFWRDGNVGQFRELLVSCARHPTSSAAGNPDDSEPIRVLKRFLNFRQVMLETVGSSPIGFLTVGDNCIGLPLEAPLIQHSVIPQSENLEIFGGGLANLHLKDFHLHFS
jgi:hypothetical protein